MKVLNAVSSGMKRFANKKYILPLLAALIIMLIFMSQGPFGSEKIKEMSAGAGTLDMRFGYSPVQAYGLLDQIGSTGRLMYSNLLGLDFLFAFVYMALQSLLITALMRKAGLSARWEKLNLLPIVRSALDIAEIFLLLFLIASFPAHHAIAVWISSVITFVKLTINYGYIALVFTLGAVTTRQTLLSKYKKQIINETRQVL